MRVSPLGDASHVLAQRRGVDRGFFDTLGIGLLRGRTFTSEDVLGSEPVVVLSQPLADRLFPGGNAVGERVTFALESLPAAVSGPNRQTLKAESPAPTFTVVGVTRDVVTSQGNAASAMFVHSRSIP